MATPLSITTFLTTAVAQGLTEAQMVAALDYAIITGISDDGNVIVTFGSDSTSYTIGYETALKMRAYYREEMRKLQGNVNASVEFGRWGNVSTDFS